MRSAIERPEDQPEEGADHPGRIARARASAEELQRRARGELEEARARHESVRLAVETFERDRTKAGGLLAGGLAYKIFLWQIPFVLALVSAFGLTAELAGTDPADLARRSGMAAALAGTIAQAVAASGEGRIWLLVLGLSLTLWAGRGVFRAVRLVSELAWGARAPRASSLKGSLAVTGFGLLTVAHQAFWSAIDLPAVLRFVLGLLTACAILTWMLSLLPRDTAPWTAMLPGGVLLGVGLRLLSLGASTYFAYRLDQSDDLYGSLSIAIVLMLYLFLLARLFVAAQFLNATLYRRKGALLAPKLEGT
ncbi:MAG: YihY/virulence factor BrkB family protein [Actinobacteria bacterium]|nr:YihY/virulence factor BrkB family protein [Actinomycetota bacterium]